MKRVTWAAAAVADLESIKVYLIEQYGGAVADRAIADLVLGAHWLLDFPRAGAPLGIGKWRKWRPRKGRHILVYEPSRSGIHVLRVRHERNDWRSVPLT